MRKQGFTLIELMIVVSILGIMAAIVIPQLQGNTLQAKESAAKSSLRTIRGQIEMYKMQHDNNPGYLSGVVLSGASAATAVTNQLSGISSATGLSTAGTTPNGTYPFGPYISEIPKNPFNGLSTISVIANGTLFSAAANGTSSGWLYKVETGEFKVNWTGADGNSVNYYDY